MKDSLFSFRIFLRVLTIAALVLTFFITIKNSEMISKGNESIQSRQLEVLSQVLVSQAALSSQKMVTDNEQERLLALANQIASDDLVFDTTIYDAEGVQLAASENAITVRESLGLDTPLATANIGKQQLIEPIMQDDNIIGYVRITFEKGRVTAFSDHHYRKSDRYMYLMLIMSFFSGVIITMLIRFGKSKKSSGENLLLNK